VGRKSDSSFFTALLEQTSDVTLHANEDARIVVFDGEYFDKRFIEWNFVSPARSESIRLRRIEKRGYSPK